MVTNSADMTDEARIVEASGAGIILTDSDARILKVNPAFSRITGYAPRDVVGRNAKILQSGRHGRRFYERMWRRLLTRGEWHGEIWDRRKNGEVYPERLSVTAVPATRAGALEYVGVFDEITAQKRYEDRLRRLAYFDSLTGLPNRVLLDDRIDRALADARRRGSCVALLFLDLDGFKRVNDGYGHEVGNRALELIARALRLGVRQSDTVARVGGDEFVVLLPDLESRRHAIPIASKILRSLRAGVTVCGHKLSLDGSIGISSYPHDGRSGRTLIHRADAAMYERKRSGRSGCRFWTSGPGRVLESGRWAPHSSGPSLHLS
jgi:diguanylate cyclase (GGDEF)-like protein/PAS domain S-box-containing protein